MVSLIYFAVQLLCPALIIVLYPVMGWWIFVILLLLLMGLYMLKFPMINASRASILRNGGQYAPEYSFTLCENRKFFIESKQGYSFCP